MIIQCRNRTAVLPTGPEKSRIPPHAQNSWASSLRFLRFRRNSIKTCSHARQTMPPNPGNQQSCYADALVPRSCCHWRILTRGAGQGHPCSRLTWASTYYCPCKPWDLQAYNLAHTFNSFQVYVNMLSIICIYKFNSWAEKNILPTSFQKTKREIKQA